MENNRGLFFVAIPLCHNGIVHVLILLLLRVGEQSERVHTATRSVFSNRYKDKVGDLLTPAVMGCLLMSIMNWLIPHDDLDEII